MKTQKETIVALAMKRAGNGTTAQGLKPGAYPVDVTVRLQGSLVVGESYRTRSVDLHRLLMASIRLNESNGISIGDVIRTAKTPMYAMHPPSLKATINESLQRALMEDLKRLKAPTRIVDHSGPVTGAINVTTIR